MHSFKRSAEILSIEQALCNAVGATSVHQYGERSPVGQVSSALRSGFKFNSVNYSGVNLKRSQSTISKESTPIFSLTRPLAGKLIVDHDGHQRVLQPGYIYLFNHSVPYETFPEWEYTTQNIVFPRAALQTLTQDLLPFYELPIQCENSPQGTMLADFSARVHQSVTTWSDREFSLLSQQILDLMIQFFVTSQEAKILYKTATRLAYLHRAKAIIQDNFADSAITPSTIAQFCGISVSYLHNIFKDEILSVESYIFECRLLWSRKILIHPAHASRSISSILYDAGFNDPAHFSRSFKSRFGVTPSESRQKPLLNHLTHRR